MTDTIAKPETKRRKIRGRRRFLFGMIYVGYVAALGWLGIKAYWYIEFDVPLTRTVHADDVWQTYYPELWKSGVIDAEMSDDDGTFDVLLLGGSVLEQTAEEMERQLKSRHGDRVRVFNLAISAHTTRDSFQKFSRLHEDKRFDLIVVYHGINDVRMNCCPRKDFRDDYSHCSWYASFQRRIKAGTLLTEGIAAAATRGKIGLGAPDEEMLDHGSDIKTESGFRENIKAIVDRAASVGTPVLLMTFAYYLTPDYSRAGFENGELDYGDGQFQLAVEIWGRSQTVAATIDAHNRVLFGLSDRSDKVLFVDQRKQMPRDGRHFSDPCHLTENGIRKFVDNLMPTIDHKFPAALQPSR